MKVSILIPCHNEEEVIAKCVRSCLNQSHPVFEVVVVNDGSTDKTARVLHRLADKIRLVDIWPNTGNKSLAQQRGLEAIKGDIVITVDADTLLDKDFVKNILAAFENNPSLAAVCGYVNSMPGNWLTACRQIEYSIGQDIYKPAQELIGYILVMPGCSTAFRTQILKKDISFDHDTITEDLDFTYQLHRHGHKIGFAPDAIVYTQDPANISSYHRQVTRWYRGGWQNLKKHYDLIIRKPAAAFEVSLLYIEGLLFSIGLLLTPLLIPVIFIEYILPISILFALVLGAAVSLKNKRWDTFIFSPVYALIMYLNSLLSLIEFVKVILLGRSQLNWLKADRRKIS